MTQMQQLLSCDRTCVACLTSCPVDFLSAWRLRIISPGEFDLSSSITTGNSQLHHTAHVPSPSLLAGLSSHTCNMDHATAHGQPMLPTSNHTNPPCNVIFWQCQLPSLPSTATYIPMQAAPATSTSYLQKIRKLSIACANLHSTITPTSSQSDCQQKLH